MSERLGEYLANETPTAAGLADIRDAIQRLAAVAQQPTGLSSVELSQTAKGLTQVTVKVYADRPPEAARIAQSIYDELTARYAPKETPA